MWTLLITIIAFGLMIFVHELGHFLVARAFNVGIERFSIGFGKAIWQTEKNGIQYRLGWMPLGGYVKMQGENPEENIGVPEERTFLGKSWWKRALIAFSGPFANLLFGLLLFVIAFMLPQKQEDLLPVIHNAKGVWAESFSAADSIISVNGKPVKGFQEFMLALSDKKNNTVAYLHNGEKRILQVAPIAVDSLLKSLEPKVDTTIGEVFTGMPAWRAGLKTGDKVLAVDSVSVANWYEMRERIISSKQDEVQLTILRDGKVLTRTIALEENVSMGDQKMIGISQYMPVKSVTRYNPWQAISYGARSTFSFIVMNYVGLYKLVMKPEQLKNNLGGPVMIATMGQQVAQRGISSLIIFLASISLVLMIMNLLPIPVLDGGHIFFAFLEGIFGKPVPIKVQAFLQRIGFALLMLLMFYAFYADISKLLIRQFLLGQ
ncbi:MAG TPA: RIP metalloprotease RseP [Candidatus Cloacimonas sp.]|nr:RIP metalloprotease RseP [Candidatus Cloacimonas sp.]HQO18409.1 RIP metalloprotease RseP [Candidatus Cloacimonas sp.]